MEIEPTTVAFIVRRVPPRSLTIAKSRIALIFHLNTRYVYTDLENEFEYLKRLELIKA